MVMKENQDCWYFLFCAFDIAAFVFVVFMHWFYVEILTVDLISHQEAYVKIVPAKENWAEILEYKD